MSKELCKIAILGDGGIEIFNNKLLGVGKSTLTVQFVQNVFVEEYDPTIEDSYRKQIKYQGEDIVLDILDTTGYDECWGYNDQKYRYPEGFLILYDITNKRTFEQVAQEIETIYRVKDVDDFPIIVIGNKIDLEDKREISFDEGKDFISKYQKIHFFEMSVKECINVEEVFYTLVDEIYKNRIPKHQPQKNDCLMM
eukprot:gene2782-4190_t